jgi:ferrous iron transport protein B
VGIQEDNWPATVGIFTGIFAKEAVVGTLDALYQDVAGEKLEEETFVLSEQLISAIVSIKDNAIGLGSSLSDPLGLAAVEESSADQGVSNTGLAAMQSLFSSRYAAFCYLVLILLYTPCVAVMGAMNRESGPMWAGLVIAWSSFLAYWCSSSLYQISQISNTPVFSGFWLLGSIISMALAVFGLKKLGKRRLNNYSENIIATDA